MTGPAMEKIWAPAPVTQPSDLNSMAALATELEKPVMGTSVPAPAWAASFWYQPGRVAAAARPIRVMLVRAPAVSAGAMRRYRQRSTSPNRQMPPPTRNAHRQSAPSREGGENSRTIRS